MRRPVNYTLVPDQDLKALLDESQELVNHILQEYKMSERNPPTPTPRPQVYEVIDGERLYQESLPPNRSEDPTRLRGVAEYLTMIDHYLRHAQDAWTKEAGNIMPLHDIRKIAALSVRCMEEWGALPREAKVTLPPVENLSGLRPCPSNE